MQQDTLQTIITSIKNLSSQDRAEIARSVTDTLDQTQFDYLKNATPNWKELKFNDFAERPAILPDFKPSDDFDSLTEQASVSGNKVQTLDKATIAKLVPQLVKESNIGLGSPDPVSLANNTGLTFTSNLFDSLSPGNFMIGVCLATAYVGSVSLATAIPFGTSVNSGDYYYYSSHDYQSTSGKGLSHVLYIANLSGGSVDIYLRSKWRYFGAEFLTAT